MIKSLAASENCRKIWPTQRLREKTRPTYHTCVDRGHPGGAAPGLLWIGWQKGDFPVPPGFLERGRLSQREMDFLKLIVQGLSNKEIAASLHLSESTIKNHVNSLLSKPHVKDRIQAVTTALKRGMVTLD